MPEQQFKIVPEPPMPTVYANSTRMMFGVYDFRLLFSEQMVSGDGKELLQVDRVAVVMSPQHLKKLMKSLMERLSDYEQKYGPIPEELEEQNASPAATDEA